MIVESERQGRVAIVRLNRPEARNAVSPDLALAVEAALDEAEADDGVRVIVLTGAPPVFCAGADLKTVASGEGRGVETLRGGFGGVARRNLDKPIIAAVNGHALAGGFEIVLACDMVVTADDAEFGLPEASRGLFAGAGGLVRLPRRVPTPVAMELAITANRITAARAYELGLVNRVVTRDAVLETAVELAEQVAANPPIAVGCALQMVREAAALTESEAWRRTRELSQEVGRSDEPHEGALAFAEKRPPKWAL